MLWEERLLAVFDDLEQQAEGLALAERDAEVAELGRAAYAAVDLASRLHAAPGSRLTLSVRGVGVVAGRVARVGADFLLVEAADRTWVVRMHALVTVFGLPDRAVGDAARSLPARVGMGSVLRGIAEATLPVTVQTTDGDVLRGRVRRVAADFVELWRAEEHVGRGDGAWVLVPFGAVAALWTARDSG